MLCTSVVYSYRGTGRFLLLLLRSTGCCVCPVTREHITYHSIAIDLSRCRSSPAAGHWWCVWLRKAAALIVATHLMQAILG